MGQLERERQNWAGRTRKTERDWQNRKERMGQAAGKRERARENRKDKRYRQNRMLCCNVLKTI